MMIEILSSLLPPNDHAGFLRSEIDYYGVSTVLSDMLDLDHAPLSEASWLHAWLEKELWIPEIFVHAGLHADPARHRVLVARKDEEEYMKENGYPLAKAVGSPFTYVPPQGRIRVANTLLIMPHHTPKGMGIADQGSVEDEYLKSLQPFFSRFESVAMCVHSDCLEHGLWHDTAEKYGIPVITGASLYDRNALRRMRTLFEVFSHMTTNKIGSHVLYASHCGMKVSWFGNAPPRKKEDMKQHIFYEKHPGYADLHARLQEEGFIEKKYAWLRSEPHLAGKHVAWAREQLGSDNRLPVRDLAALLGWELESQYGPAPGRIIKGLQKDKDDLARKLHTSQKKLADWSRDLSRSLAKLRESSRWRLGGWLIHPFSRKRRQQDGWMGKLAATSDAMTQYSGSAAHEKSGAKPD